MSGRSLALAHLLAICLGSGLAFSATLRIAPLGDSITQANVSHYSYRYNLWIKLVDAGADFDLVGSMDSNLWGNPSWPEHAGQSFDPDHEGHFGWEANEILAGRPGEGRLETWLQGYTPDVVLMHLGTNDAVHGQSTESTVSELEAIIDLLQVDNPQVVILLARLIPSTDTLGGAIPPLNAEMDGIADRKRTPLSRIIVVDQYTGFDPWADLYDAWHPNAQGEEKMAQRWFEALQAGPRANVRLRLEGDGETVGWDPVDASEAYTIYRGSLSGLRDADADGRPDGGYGICQSARDPDLTDTVFVDAEQPGPGTAGFFYLVGFRFSDAEWGLGEGSEGRRHPDMELCP
jgi:hypothetical protein